MIIESKELREAQEPRRGEALGIIVLDRLPPPTHPRLRAFLWSAPRQPVPGLAELEDE